MRRGKGSHLLHNDSIVRDKNMVLSDRISVLYGL